MERMYHWICMPKAEFLMSHEMMDDLTEYVEVAGVGVLCLLGPCVSAMVMLRLN